jgi:hypothetical protein
VKRFENVGRYIELGVRSIGEILNEQILKATIPGLQQILLGLVPVQRLTAAHFTDLGLLVSRRLRMPEVTVQPILASPCCSRNAQRLALAVRVAAINLDVVIPERGWLGRRERDD